MPLRYVILRHEGIPEPHFDLMFETSPGGPLATWRADAWPIDRPTTITRLADHRRDYLDYEGPVSGNRGHVRRIVGGECQIDIAADGRWTIRLPEQVLSLKPISGDRWTAEPAQATL